MTILLTGGTGQTASRIAHVLKDANQSVPLTSRKNIVPEPFKGVKFVWYDPSTFENVFAADPNIDRVYLVAPEATSEVFPLMKPFIDLAVQKGVKRFFLLTTSTMTDNYPLMSQRELFDGVPVNHQGKEHDHKRVCRRKDWIHIRRRDCAEVVVSVLTDEKSHDTDHITTGLELLTDDDVAAIFTDVLGRKDYPHMYRCRTVEGEIHLVWSSIRFIGHALVSGGPEC
ncbi:hypothetical protein ARMGADRAFT_1171559 [Armillaria gallica]|uniref:NAD(P)-binding domain-containing protein n=1 Tax=Armillaria gallica TaxID=47427 RepID=A0A2H3CDF0_ARMGA|nr:hypothetical protein ARMGADRAFT_1171559 [Armillaria gallica]